MSFNEKKITTNDLSAEHPHLAAQIESEMKTADIRKGVQAERDRIRNLDEVAHLFDSSLIYSAKYGDSPCSVAELANRVECLTPAQKHGIARQSVKTLLNGEKQKEAQS